MKPMIVIAEAGVNHNGSLDLALELVDAAAAAGADLVKFQTFRAAKLVGREAPKAAYQREATGAEESQYEMLRRLELDADAHRLLMRRCRERGIGSLSTPFDADSLDFLALELGLTRLKLSSGEITNAPLLLKAAQSGREVILSTGMSTLAEVEEALGSGIKAPSHSERKNLPVVRKSLVAARAIRRGDLFGEDNLSARRPGSGVSPMRYWQWAGKEAARGFEEGEEIG